MKSFKTVEAFFAGQEVWQDELLRLREVLVSTPLEETLKWSRPCYTHRGKNVVGISGFKEYFGLWFHQGALLEDKHGVLVNAQEGVTKALRQWRMERMTDIKPRIIKSYVNEAMNLVEAGKEIKADRKKPLVVPVELKNGLAKSKRARARFDEMSLGKQREYCHYIGEAKREETRFRRLQTRY